MKHFKLFENWDGESLNEARLSNKGLRDEILKQFSSEYEKHSSGNRLFSRGTTIEDLEKRMQSVLTGMGVPYEDMVIVPARNKNPFTNKDISSSYDSVAFKVDGKDYALTLADQTNAGPTTEQHESCSILLFERALKNNDPLISNYMDELVKIYPGIEGDKGWLTAFQSQVNALITYLKGHNTKGYSFFRDDTFTDDLYKHAKKLAGFSKKDSWNPADVWIIDNPSKRIKELLNTTSVAELNNVLREGLRTKTIIPISLKKTKKTASVQELNLEAQQKKIIKVDKIYMDMLFDNDKKSFKNNGASIYLNNSAKFACRSSDARRLQFVFEGTMKGAAAQLGKVPKNILNSLIPNVKSNQNDWKSFNKDQRILKSMFNFVNKSKIVDDNNADWKSFSAGMEFYSNNIPLRYAEKCTALNYINNLLKERNYEEIVTKLFFAAQKKGEDFGPFIKIY
jgi:hypothetical protein